MVWRSASFLKKDGSGVEQTRGRERGKKNAAERGRKGEI
jgi:hypothetical protein